MQAVSYTLNILCPINPLLVDPGFDDDPNTFQLQFLLS